MLYLVALILPPLALLMVGAWFQAILNLILFLLSIVIFVGTLTLGSGLSFPLWIVSIGWAVFVVYRVKSDQRTRQIVTDTLRNNP